MPVISSIRTIKPFFYSIVVLPVRIYCAMYAVDAAINALMAARLATVARRMPLTA